MSQMGMVKTGFAFVLGTICGSIVTRSRLETSCHGHKHEGRRNWPCPRGPSEKKTIETPAPAVASD